ncbi:VOC family protein [Micromonosporaceae bacterium Da 78-11]
MHVDDVDAARAELTARGVDLVGEPFEIDDISRRPAFVRDRWGNMIELSHRLPGVGAWGGYRRRCHGPGPVLLGWLARVVHFPHWRLPWHHA